MTVRWPATASASTRSTPSAPQPTSARPTPCCPAPPREPCAGRCPRCGRCADAPAGDAHAVGARRLGRLPGVRRPGLLESRLLPASRRPAPLRERRRPCSSFTAAISSRCRRSVLVEPGERSQDARPRPSTCGARWPSRARRATTSSWRSAAASSATSRASAPPPTSAACRVVHVPTTLVAQVDSAYGGKTGVDMPEAKNYVGAYHQPAAVLADPATLLTLPPEELAAGYAEVVKTALIAGGACGSGCATARPAPPSPTSSLACARTKLAVVAQDERDAGARQVLNLGHTVGHAIEAADGYGALPPRRGGRAGPARRAAALGPRRAARGGRRAAARARAADAPGGSRAAAPSSTAPRATRSAAASAGPVRPRRGARRRAPGRAGRRRRRRGGRERVARVNRSATASRSCTASTSASSAAAIPISTAA